ncbi:MAG: hypothetical protein HDT05_03625, partial [Bacteroidales bacterium]|nr:hypothetical protein [Bacteroidales bacterium]
MNASKTILLCAAASIALSASAEEHLKSLSKEGISSEITANEDFYRHVNQHWMDANPLTGEHSRYGQFNILDDSSKNRVRRIVANLASTNPDKGSVAYKIAALYETGMDSINRNRLGATPIQPVLKQIEATPNNKMDDLLIFMHKYYSAPFFGAGLQEDLNNSAEYAMYVSGVGLELGDRDYYLAKDADNKKIRNAYQ